MMKLNLGCGSRPLEGWVNVDKYPPAQLIQDLEKLPWPWEENSADEVLLCHVLEHLGQTPDMFLKIMQELYRVCKPDAKITIMVPDPRHDVYLNDPTHVRPVTTQMLQLFSKKQCESWIRENKSNTPLALQLGVDFEIVATQAIPDPRMAGKSDAEIADAYRRENNVVSEFVFLLKAVK